MFDEKVSAQCISNLSDLRSVDAVVTRWGFAEYDGRQTLNRLEEMQARYR